MSSDRIRVEETVILQVVTGEFDNLVRSSLVSEWGESLPSTWIPNEADILVVSNVHRAFSTLIDVARLLVI